MNGSECKKLNLVFIALSSLSAALLVTSFLMPPQGIIDGSVLTASAELIGMFALYEFFRMCWSGKFGRFHYKNLDIDINNGKVGPKPPPPPPEFGD